ncbi:hypothetical protein ACOV1V_09645 [Leclercia pneumoniae]|uniref:hypothetical protein n=1 Tax=Leclercia pneumoniae TaxID=2815358 RepID=UPI003BF46357
MNKITDVQLDVLIRSAVNSSNPLPPDEKFAQIISALRELRELRAAMLQAAAGNSPAIPDGWVLVPVDPTAEMQSAAPAQFGLKPLQSTSSGLATPFTRPCPQQQHRSRRWSNISQRRKGRFGMYYDKATEKELALYISLFKEIGATEHYEVNEYITNNDMWYEFSQIRSLNDHGRGKENIPGIQPKFFREVCQRLKISGGKGSPLVRSKQY